MEATASLGKSLKAGKRKSQNTQSKNEKARKEAMFKNLELKLEIPEKQIREACLIDSSINSGIGSLIIKIPVRPNFFDRV